MSIIQSNKISELEMKCKKATAESNNLQDKIKSLEDKISKQDTVVRRPVVREIGISN